MNSEIMVNENHNKKKQTIIKSKLVEKCKNMKNATNLLQK